MNKKPFILSLFLLLFFFVFGFFFVKPIHADTFTLSGNVKDSSGNLIIGATVDVYAQGTTNDVVSPITTDQSGNYNFASVPQGTYDIKVTPPSGSNYSSNIEYNQSISSNTVLNFVLVPALVIGLKQQERYCAIAHLATIFQNHDRHNQVDAKP